jgi:hypothetical protein
MPYAPSGGNKNKPAKPTSYQALIAPCLTLDSCLAYSFILWIQEICSSETSADFYGLHDIISQKIKFFIVNDVANSNPNIVLMKVLSFGRSCIADRSDYILPIQFRSYYFTAHYVTQIYSPSKINNSVGSR